jgi:hypothetical protein
LGDAASPQQLGFFLDVLGFIGAKTGYPALRVSVVSPTQIGDAAGRDLLILSAAPHESQSLDRLITGPAEVSEDKIKLRESSSPFRRFLALLPFISNDARRGAEEVASADPGPDGFLSEFPSPLSSDHTALAIRTVDITKLEPLEDAFAGQATIAQVYGSLTLLQGGQFHSFFLEPNYQGQGQLGPVERLHQWIVSYYWTIPLFLFLIAALLASSVNRWLEERARFRLEAHS